MIEHTGALAFRAPNHGSVAKPCTNKMYTTDKLLKKDSKGVNIFDILVVCS